MTEPERKVIAFPISIGTVRLTFTKDDDGDWACHLPDDFIRDLEDAVAGRVPKERVRWIDIPNFGNN
jgi:hypothetical protein